ncbi:HlyD family secretion protein [Bryobacter aggregatus]|uniref:HlyD family secretion protein n=1 Tax=Bryobacter aggregatus TaxID=360054 RepID=UPI0004E13F7A|nr:biotin/lipoyl-binding protein [Bryobacter aggregatus]
MQSRLGKILSSRWALYGPVALIACLIAIAAWWGYQEYRKREKVAAEASKPALLPDPLHKSYPGKLRAQKTVLVAAPVEGVLEAVDVVDGQEVFEGQVLARIQNSAVETEKQRSVEDLDRAKTKLSELESQVLAARLEASRASADLARVRSEYDTAQRLFEKTQKLYREGAAARLAYEKAEAAFFRLAGESKDLDAAAKSADARVTNLQANVETARTAVQEKTADIEDADAEMLSGEVKAPVSGLLIQHRRNAGEEVTRDMNDLFEIATDLTSMEVVVEIPEDVAKKLGPEGQALVQIAEAGETPLQGTIRELRQGTAIVAFLSPGAGIKPGMSASVRFLH